MILKSVGCSIAPQTPNFTGDSEAVSVLVIFSHAPHAHNNAAKHMLSLLAWERR